VVRLGNSPATNIRPSERLDASRVDGYAFLAVFNRKHVAETPLQVTQPQASSPETPSVVEVLVDAAKTNILRVQDYSKLCFRSLTNLATSPRYMQDTLVQMDDIGVGSLPIVLLSGFFIGAVLVLQTGAQFERFGQTMLTGDVVSIALVRELGPAITGLLVAGRCASGIASELGSMQVTEQVDAMRAMGTDPSRKLVSPRVLATLLTLPLLTTISVFVGLVGGMVASVFSLRLDATTFWERAIAVLEFSDLMQGFTKSVVFGFILATVGCYQGLNVRGGTQGVGRATTQAVVVSSVMIIVADTFLTKIALFLADKVF
jgi:phospholipid/cholesterol/gamma-HCH transport system permease protein